MKSLHISLNTTHSACKPSTFISSSTHSLSHSKSSHSSPYISPLPTPHFYRPTPNHPHSYAPDVQTTSIYPASPHPPHSVHPKDFSDTPHIHVTIIRSVLSRLYRFSFFIAQVSVPYVNTLWTQALYIFPFMWYDAPQAVRSG